ncbi:MAG: conjugal transfer protein TraG, partial [Gammaproteobacteria bacterium]|nr:conjugal transfer protein TraG [Gammaproteobacteria bacterium]
MIEFILYTYGYGDLMIFVLNGIAKFRNSGAYTSILFVTAGAVISYYATRMAAATTPGGWRIWVHKTVSTLLLIQVLMLPTVTLVVKDEVSWKVPRTVDNIPAAFGVPVSLIEGWGHAMVKGFEQAFNWTGKKRLNSYSKHGTVFGARMAQDIARAKIRNPEVSQSVNSFVDRC